MRAAAPGGGSCKYQQCSVRADAVDRDRVDLEDEGLRLAHLFTCGPAGPAPYPDAVSGSCRASADSQIGQCFAKQDMALGKAG